MTAEEAFSPMSESIVATGIRYRGDALQRLRDARAWIFDMDGVLYRGSEPLAGVSELIRILNERKLPYMLATNNSMSTSSEYVVKLAKMNIDVPASSILTSAMATRDYLLQEFEANAGFFVIGMPALGEQLFLDTPFHAVDPLLEQPAGIVVGLDKNFTYEKLSLANSTIRAGARFIATNTDATLPTESGLVPGCGSIIAAIETSTSSKPVVIGKPEPLMLEMALARMGVAPGEAVMIGDRLDTDILAGKRAGMLTLLVLTGVSQREDVPTGPAIPDLIFSDLNAVIDAITLN